MARMPFTKMHGAGNDFVMVLAADLGGMPPLSGQRIAALCHRRTGIGADGLIVVGTPADADLRMDYYNADGGEAEMCGNGARCTVAFAHRRGLCVARGTLATASGPLGFQVHGAEEIEVDLPAPRDVALDLDVAGAAYPALHACNTGVPHLVIPVPDLDAVAVERDGRELRHHPRFAPAGTNVNWVCRDEAAGQWHLRTYERGVEAETLACGTGAAATALILCRLGLAASPVAIRTRGGDLLTISVDLTLPRLGLRGPAIVAYEGEVSCDA
jgi:diaminopimelate epimerase